MFGAKVRRSEQKAKETLKNLLFLFDFSFILYLCNDLYTYVYENGHCSVWSRQGILQLF